MRVEKMTPEIEEDNERIALDNVKRDGYIVAPIPNYPKNGKHMECYTDLPCKVVKGLDTFKNKKKWHVTFYENINIPMKIYSTVSEAMRGAKHDYLKYLKEQIYSIEKGILK